LETEIINEFIKFSLRFSYSLKINLEIIDYLIGNEKFELINTLVSNNVILDSKDMKDIEK
jgi:hypothetical protein